MSYWNRRQRMPNVQYFTNGRIAQGHSIVNQTEPHVASKVMTWLFLTVNGAHN